MFILNSNADYRQPLTPGDAETLGLAAAEGVEHHLRYRENHAETPLISLPGLAAASGVAAIHVKDEGKPSSALPSKRPKLGSGGQST